MAVTYADLVAFGFAYVENNVSCNQGGLQLKPRPAPLLRPGDSCPCSEEDFILLAEFSEIKGPVALVTIPSQCHLQATIDINSFIMRIMSVDYQANPWGQFSVCQDTQVLQTYISSDRHAYVHYFTLYDLHARGFVRPMCIAYVSADQRKLHRLFPQMRRFFLEITEAMKVENRSQFSSEIVQTLQAMETFSSPQQQGDTSQVPSTSLGIKGGEYSSELLPNQCTDLKRMLQVVQASLIESEFLKATLEHWHSALTMENDSDVPRGIQLYLKLVSTWASSNMASFKINDGGCVLEKHLRPMPALCPWGMACALWRLFLAVKTFNHCDLSTYLGSFPTLSSLECGSPLTNKSHSSSAWEALAEPEYLLLIEALAEGALEASTFCKEDKRDLPVPEEGTSGNEGSSSYHSLSDSPSGPCPNTQLKIEVENTSILNGPNRSLELSSDAPKDQNRNRLTRHETCSVVNDNPPRVDGGSSPFLVNGESSNNLSPHIQGGKCKRELNTYDEYDTTSDDSESFHDIMETLNGDDTWSSGSSYNEPSLNESWNQCLWTQYRPVNKSGYRLLKFFWTFRSAAQHVIYSLLMGRTLVLAGDSNSEHRVSRILNALIPLMPPLDSNGLRVLRWHQGILVSAHIASYQVIGMCVPERLSVHDMISPRDKNSVSILDVNSEQLLGPAYQGQLLAAIGSNVRDFPSDHSVLLFIQSVLSGIGCKLQAYKALVSSCGLELPSHVCRQLDLHGCDADMIRFLSKLPT